MHYSQFPQQNDSVGAAEFSDQRAGGRFDEELLLGWQAAAAVDLPVTVLAVLKHLRQCVRPWVRLPALSTCIRRGLWTRRRSADTAAAARRPGGAVTPGSACANNVAAARRDRHPGTTPKTCSTASRSSTGSEMPLQLAGLSTTLGIPPAVLYFTFPETMTKG